MNRFCRCRSRPGVPGPGLARLWLVGFLLLLGPAAALGAGEPPSPDDPEQTRERARDVADALKRGNGAYVGGRYREALGWYAQFQDNVDCKLGVGLCLVKLGNPARARPLLLDVYKVYPTNRYLLEALGTINESEIDSLRRELAAMRPEDRSGPVKRARLVALYELNGHPLEAARLLLALTPSSRMDLDQLLRVARLLTSGGRFSHAGEIYEKAMRLSDDPRTTGLAAVDSYLAGLDPGRAELVLNRLAKARPGPDLDARYATVYARTGRFKRARPLYANLAQVSETAAASSTEPRTNRLTALDSYLNARMYPEAQRLIDELVRETPGYDVDARQARLYHERRQFSRAITIYSRYPDDLAMQASRGWALTQMGCWKDAKHVFTGILNKDPSNWSARSGYQATLHHMPWDVFAIATRMYYSGYRGDRWLHTQNLRYADKRAVVTATHTRTDVIRPESRAVDFNEDAYGLKAYYQLDDKNSLQLLVLNFQNDDPLTDDGTVLGGEYRHVAGRRWSFGMEYDFSNFELGKIYQVATAAGLRFGEKVRCEVKGVLVRRDLVGSSKHPVSRAFRTSLTYWPHPRCVLALSGWVGERPLAADSAGMYTYNSLDVYKGGWATFGLVKLARPLKLYVGYTYAPFTAPWQEDLRRDLPGRVFLSDRFVSILSFGLDYMF